MTMIKVKPKRPTYTGERVYVPGWMTDPDLPAPCFCGHPLMPNQPHIMGEGELGFKRWFHMSCWQMFMGDDDDPEEWDD